MYLHIHDGLVVSVCHNAISKIAKRQIIPKLHYFQSHTYLFFGSYDNVIPTQDKTNKFSVLFLGCSSKSHPKYIMYIASDIQLRAGSRGHDQSMFELDGGHDHKFD